MRNRLERWLFNPAAAPRDARAHLRLLAGYPYALLRDLIEGQLNLRAMSLVYGTLLAVVPLIAFSFAILSLFGLHRELEPLVFQFFQPTGAAAADLTRRVMSFAENLKVGLLGTVGFVLLLWTVIGTIKKVEDSLNFVWHVEVPRKFLRRIAEYLGLIVVGPLLIGAVIGMSQLAAQGPGGVLLERLPWQAEIRDGLLRLAPYLFISGLFALVYAFVPNTKVRATPALAGGLFAGLLWVAVGSLFTAFVASSYRLDVVYAGLAIVVTALVWTYLGWLILLLGAQLSFYVQNPGYLRVGQQDPRLSNLETEQLCFSLMYLVARGHAQGSERWSVQSLAARAGIPAVVVARVTHALERAGLLVSTEREELLPARDIGAIRLREILEVARHCDALQDGPHPQLPVAVKSLCGDLEAARDACCGERSLRDLAGT